MEAGLSSGIRTYSPFYGRDFLGQRVGITKLWHVAVVDITIVSSSFHTVGSAIYAGRRKLADYDTTPGLSRAFTVVRKENLFI